MEIVYDNTRTDNIPGTVATIGFFDGVHKGHRFLISKIRDIAARRGLCSAVVTFPVHPRFVMNSSFQPVMLSTFDEKMQLLGECGLDYCFVMNFTKELASLTARQFMADVLKARFNVSVLVIGYDHRFGHNREEGFEDYCRYGKELGIEVCRADSYVAGRYEISSSSIRRYLSDGEIHKATFSLGREYSITGRVVGGYQVGRKIGFPTANIQAADDKLIPSNGVYAVRVIVDGCEYKGMLNIGNRPTVANNGARSIEVHIFDFNKTIYNETVTLTFTEKVRDEHKFSSLEQLTEQLENDERHIRTLYFIEDNRDCNPRDVALRASGNSKLDVAYAASQIEGRSMARRKLPEWASIDGIVYPRHLSMEQCSSEDTARYKASLVEGDSMTDLTGGFGVDCYFLSGKFRTSVYVEQQRELCDIVRNNMSLLNAGNVTVVNSDAVHWLANMDKVSLIYLDPARRDSNGGKTVFVSQCEPDVTAINDMLLDKADKVMIKLSPMLDIAQAQKEIHGTERIYIVSDNNECKELLMILSHEVCREPEIMCVNITKDKVSEFAFTRSGEEQAVVEYAGSPMQYLYEPNTSVLKAGAYKSVAVRYGVMKLSPNSHLYTSDRLADDFPGRIFRVVSIYDFGKKSLKTLASECPKANITVRNFPASVSELRKRLKIAEGGEDYIFATTLNDSSRVLVRCVRP